MDITVELASQDIKIEIGALEDLRYLVKLLDGAWEDWDYSLEAVKGKKNQWMFVKRPKKGKEEFTGLVEVEKGTAYAHSPLVHDLIMEEYGRYTAEFGDIPTE